MPAQALLVIDVQRGMFPAGGGPWKGEEVVLRIAGLIEKARRAGVPVIHVRHAGGPGHPLEPGTEGWSFHPAVEPRPDETVIDKYHVGAFHRTDLETHLIRAGIRHLAIAGFQTKFCVDTACRTAVERGFEATLVADGHSTFDTETLSAERIVAHHNRTLGDGFVTLSEAGRINFSRGA